MTESNYHSGSGLWQPNHLQKLFYGAKSVEEHLKTLLPTPKSKAFIITGTSLATKTGLIDKVEKLLGPEQHAGTFSRIKQHAPIAELDEAVEAVGKQADIDTVISIGGGSPIDSAKVISYRTHEKIGRYLHHIAIPTTLSAAECTHLAGYTNTEGRKTGVRQAEISPDVIIYDPVFAVETPPHLFLSTGIRALDHAVELMYHPTTAEVPTKQLCLQAIAGLFKYLPKYKENPRDGDVITSLLLSAYASLGLMGTNLMGGIGLSHSLGYALGSPYAIPHGVTSCLTLAQVVKLKAENPQEAEQIARISASVGPAVAGRSVKDEAIHVGDRILALVQQLGLSTNLRKYNVGDDQAELIAKTALGTDSGDLFNKIVRLVKGLY